MTRQELITQAKQASVGMNTTYLTYDDGQRILGIPSGTLRNWASLGFLKTNGTNLRGRTTFTLDSLIQATIQRRKI